MQEQIAQLSADHIALALGQGVVQLQHLLDQVRAQGLPGLRPVPGAADAEVAHHREGTSKR